MGWEGLLTTVRLLAVLLFLVILLHVALSVLTIYFACFHTTASYKDHTVCFNIQQSCLSELTDLMDTICHLSFNLLLNNLGLQYKWCVQKLFEEIYTST